MNSSPRRSSTYSFSSRRNTRDDYSFPSRRNNTRDKKEDDNNAYSYFKEKYFFVVIAVLLLIFPVSVIFNFSDKDTRPHQMMFNSLKNRLDNIELETVKSLLKVTAFSRNVKSSDLQEVVIVQKNLSTIRRGLIVLVGGVRVARIELERYNVYDNNSSSSRGKRRIAAIKVRNKQLKARHAKRSKSVRYGLNTHTKLDPVIEKLTYFIPLGETKVFNTTNTPTTIHSHTDIEALLSVAELVALKIRAQLAKGKIVPYANQVRST